MNNSTMFYCVNELIDYLDELYKDSLTSFTEYELHQKGETFAYLDALNLFKEKSTVILMDESVDQLKEVIYELQKKYNKTLDFQPNESKEDTEIRAGKTFAYYDILNKIDIHLMISCGLPRRLFDVIAPNLNNIDKKIDNTITKPLPSRAEIKETLLLLLSNKISKEDVHSWANDWIIANPEAGKIEDGIAWEIVNHLQFIIYTADDVALKDTIKEWLELLEQR